MATRTSFSRDFSLAPFVIFRVFKNKVVFLMSLMFVKCCFFFSFGSWHLLLHFLFFFMNLVLKKHSTCNGWLRPGTTEKNPQWIFFWGNFSNIFPFCPTILLSVFKVIHVATWCIISSPLGKYFYFGGKRLRNLVPKDFSPLEPWERKMNLPYSKGDRDYEVSGNDEQTPNPHQLNFGLP